MISRIVFVSTIIVSTIFIMFNACEQKPSEPNYNNVFDPDNEQTEGDPFQLTASIANGGVTLTWNLVDIENLSNFKVYRSENETSGYTTIKMLEQTDTVFVDTTVQNGHNYWYRVTAINKSGKETQISNTAGVNINTDPLLVINGGEEYTHTREVSLTILAATAEQMIISNYNNFSDGNWESYAITKNWTLLVGEGQKTVYLKVKYENDEESNIIQSIITPEPVSNTSFSIGSSDTTNTLDVTLNIQAENATEMMISNDNSFSESDWEVYLDTKNWQLDFSKAVNSKVSVFIKFKNDFEIETNVISDDIFLEIASGIKINNDDTYTSTRSVTLNLFSENADEMMISNNADFSAANWETYVDTKEWILLTGAGSFTVYAKFKNSSGLISKVYSDDILPQPIDPALIIAEGELYTSTRDVVLTLTADGSNLQMKISEDSTFSGINWQSYAETSIYQLSTGDGEKTVYARLKNDFEIESALVSDAISPQPINPSIEIAGGEQYSTTRDVQVSLSASGANLQMRLSEDSTFAGINWQEYLSAPNFQLSSGDGTKKVFVQFKNDFQFESKVINDDIIVDTTPPTIALTVTPDSGITNETNFQFDPTASSDNLSPAQDLQVRFDWENDGSFDTDWQKLSIVNYQYSIGGGDKMVKMQLKDGLSWQVDTTSIIFVNTRPQASFTAIVDNNNYKLYHFDASVSSDYEDGKNLEFLWDFDGNGSLDTDWLTQDTISFEYSDDDDYLPTLSVRDQKSLINETSINLTVTPSIIDIDGNVYKIVQIGDQWWMAENLKVTRYRNSESIHNVTDNSEWASLNSGAFCAYDNNDGNVEIYGLLYNWHAVNDSRNIAPSGWHVPSDEEWKDLEMHLGMSQTDADEYGFRGTDEGGKMKEESTIYWNSPNTGATNESGFSALPGGHRNHVSGNYLFMGEYATFWSTTKNYSYTAWTRRLRYNNSDIQRYFYYDMLSGFSVRCIKD